MQRKTPVINPVVVLRKEFDDWAVLFNPDTAEAVGISPVGVAVWEALARNREPKTVIEHVKLQFSNVPDTVETEIDAFISELAERGFIGFEQTVSS